MIVTAYFHVVRISAEKRVNPPEVCYTKRRICKEMKYIKDMTTEKKEGNNRCIIHEAKDISFRY